jgi:hypothetical protein
MKKVLDLIMNEIVAEDAPTGKDEDDNDDKHAADN